MIFRKEIINLLEIHDLKKLLHYYILTIDANDKNRI